jgi:hypothetical protein
VLHQNLGKQQIQVVSWLSNTKMLRNHKPAHCQKDYLLNLTSLQAEEPHTALTNCDIPAKSPQSGQLNFPDINKYQTHVQNLHRTVLLHKTIPMYRITS